MCSHRDDDAIGPDRRAFLIGTAATAAVATAPAIAQAPLAFVAPTRVLDNSTVVHGAVSILHNGKAALDGYMARPRREGRFPGVIVIAGNRISEEYIPNTCAALALAGFVGLAPNLYHIVPPEAETNAQIAAASEKHDEDDVLLDMQAGLDHLRRQEFVRPGGFGVLGFCFGGRIALKLGHRSREIDAVVAFHPAPALRAAEVQRLRAPVQIHSGTADRAAPIDQIAALTTALKKQGTPAELHAYEGADHGFLAYTRPHRYHPVAAQRAWARTCDFFGQHLR